MPTTILTTDDLREFKMELLQEIKELISEHFQKADKKEFLRSAQVMDMLQISAGTLQTLRLNGTLPFVRIGGLIFYEAGEIERVLMKHLVPTKRKKR